MQVILVGFSSVKNLSHKGTKKFRKKKRLFRRNSLFIPFFTLPLHTNSKSVQNRTLKNRKLKRKKWKISY